MSPNVCRSELWGHGQSDNLGIEFLISKHQKRLRRTGHWACKSKTILEMFMPAIFACMSSICWMSSKCKTLSTHSSSTESTCKSQDPRRMACRTWPRQSFKPLWSPCLEKGWQGNPPVNWVNALGFMACSFLMHWMSSMLPWITGVVKLQHKTAHARDWYPGKP